MADIWFSFILFVLDKGQTFGAPGWMAGSATAVRGHVRTCPLTFGVSVLMYGVGDALRHATVIN
jgi:hypothetical protein